jgi:carbon starvation protein
MHAMPLMIGILCVLAIAYRYYSAFIAARVVALSDSAVTPAERFNDGHNYHPTNKWVLFGHHFAAISGAGPLIGPVLAAQFGYLPGLLWIVIGVCLGGAVQDFLVLVASIRRDGKSLAQIAYSDIGKVAGTAGTVAILFIIVIALAGLGKVVVKALGGESVKYPADSFLTFTGQLPPMNPDGTYTIPAGTGLQWNGGKSQMTFSDSFLLKPPLPLKAYWQTLTPAELRQINPIYPFDAYFLPSGTVRLVPGSHWGTFTIACTIPIALLVGLWMYKIRPGHVVEASIIGGVLTLVVTFLGGLIPAGGGVANFFNLSQMKVTWAMAIYGFVASVLPVWILLCPRDYLSSFLKIGTIALLVLGTIFANPKMEAPAYNTIFASGGPTVGGRIFPFLFITIMCGAISGFHALVSSGTTPKMIKKETHARTIGYGAMLIEGLVGCVAMIAASALPTNDYYAMNTDLAAVPKWHDKILQVGAGHGLQDVDASRDNLPVYEQRTQESLRGRTGGAVTLAVGMAHIFDQAAGRFMASSKGTLEGLWKYWYHFAIMFEALFILTTIDTGTRIGRFLLQEAAGKLIHPKLAITSWMPGAIVSTGLVVLGWAWFMNSDSFDVIWRTFGIANQTLAVIALAVVSAFLVNEGRTRYVWVTLIPLAVVLTTTSSAGIEMISSHVTTLRTQFAKPTPDWTVALNSMVQGGLIVAMLLCAFIIIAAGAARVLGAPTRARVGFAVGTVK